MGRASSKREAGSGSRGRECVQIVAQTPAVGAGANAIDRDPEQEGERKQER